MGTWKRRRKYFTRLFYYAYLRYSVVQKTLTATIATQTDEEKIIETVSMSIQTDEEKVIDPVIYSVCNSVIQKCIDNIYKEDMSIQCNLIEEYKIEQIERTTTTQSSDIHNDFYILSYFKIIDRKITELSIH